MCGVSAMGSTLSETLGPVGNGQGAVVSRASARSSASGGGFLRGRLTLQPCLEIGLGQCVDHDGHVAVAPAAELRALAAVDAGLVGVDFEPALVDVAGN